MKFAVKSIRPPQESCREVAEGLFRFAQVSRGGYHVKRNMVNSSVRTWYTIIIIKIRYEF